MSDEWSSSVAARELRESSLDPGLLARLRVQLLTKPSTARSRHASDGHLNHKPVLAEPIDRAASLHHSRGDSGGSHQLSPLSLASSRSLGSLSDTEPPPPPFDQPLPSASKASADSALGESICSKRSSLDRKSACSSVLSGEAATWEESSPTAKEPRSRLNIPTISLPRLPFGRKGSEGSSSGGWRLFAKATEGPISTSGLILQPRPAGVAAKTAEEEARHRRLYDEMMEAARRREAREAKARRKAEEEQRRAEEALSAQTRAWTQTYLPRWAESKDSKRCRELWWLGLPPSVRGRVWKLAIGNSLNLTPDLYEICASRALERLANPETEEASSAESPGHARNPSSASFAARLASEAVVNRESTVELVQLDVSRTFTGLGIFQKGGPYYDLLLNLLGAYVCYRPDVGYVQGMSFVAAVLLLNMEPAEAFIAFANLLNRPLQLALFRLRQPEMARYFAAFDAYFRQELPALHAHFAALDIAPDLYLIEWLYTLYARTLPLDVASRVWDLYLRDGEDALFKVAIALLTLLQPVLQDADFDGALQMLAALPSQYSGAEPLFEVLGPLYKREGSGDRKRFSQILAEMEAGGALSASKSLGSLRSMSPTPSTTSSGLPKSVTGLLPDWLRQGERDPRD